MAFAHSFQLLVCATVGPANTVIAHFMLFYLKKCWLFKKVWGVVFMLVDQLNNSFEIDKPFKGFLSKAAGEEIAQQHH
jgi:hypothetical protein